MKLIKKENGIAEAGDAVVCSWVILCDGEIADDTTNGPVVYDLGSNKFPFDEYILGMKDKQDRSFDMVWPALDKLGHLTGKEVRVNISVKSVRRKAA
jgi:FKBP-type peptidyl-prolyl cis-trans isomerase (trigger factor)